MKLAAAMIMAAVTLPAMASAQDRELCPSLAGLDTGPCVLDKGRVEVETSLFHRVRDRQPDSVETDWLIGDTLLRYGLDGLTELQAEWVPYGHVSIRDRMTGEVERTNRTGDLTLGFRRNFRDPDGEGFSLAVQPSLFVPVGRQPVGGGTWGAQLIVPVSFEFSDALHLTLDPEVDATPDEDGDGRHLAYGGVASLEWDLSKSFQLQADYAGLRDRDPTGHATAHRAALSATWLGRDVALYLTGIRALNHNAPDNELLVGVVRRF